MSTTLSNGFIRPETGDTAFTWMTALAGNVTKTNDHTHNGSDSNQLFNAAIATTAAIARSKLASGSASHVLINDVSGVMSSEATLAVSRGGLNIASYTAGDTVYASGSTAFSKLAIGTVGQAYVSTGAAPSWSTVDIRGGGHGLTSFTAGDILYYASGNILSKLAIGSIGQILKVSGATLPSWGAASATLSTTTKTTANSPYTALNTDDLIRINASGGAVTVNLPAAASNGGKQLIIKKIDSTVNTVTIDANASELIDGALTVVIQDQWQSLTLVCDGTGWNII